MSHRVWILVEWVDERNVFPSYGIVNVDTLAYNITDLSVGNVICISIKRGNSRRAEILRMSADSKRYLKEHKEVLERQDQKVKNVLQLCMRTIKEMKSESQYLTSMDSRNTNIRDSQNSIPHITFKGDMSASDSETEDNENIDDRRVLHRNKLVKYRTHYNTKEIDHRQNRSLCSPSNYQKPRSVTTSTPLSGNITGNARLCLDQGTQTDTLMVQPPLDKIEEMEIMLKSLYRRFHSLIAEVNVNNLESICASDLELNENEESFIGPTVSESWAEHNNNQFGESEQPEELFINDIVAEQVIDGSGTDKQVNGSVVKVEQDKQNASTLRVRRMSAQTTNNIEQNPVADSDMVPIGSGNATVPARLLNEIDWNSHTVATRQLLQAIFPRKILATHSLTGKQSPAFTNKPPKKILDPKLVEDIVKTVSLRSGVPKNLVRNTITIKCTDEAKLYRNRQYRHARHTMLQNDENAPPSPASSDESLSVNN